MKLFIKLEVLTEGRQCICPRGEGGRKLQMMLLMCVSTTYTSTISVSEVTTVQHYKYCYLIHFTFVNLTAFTTVTTHSAEILPVCSPFHRVYCVETASRYCQMVVKMYSPQHPSFLASTVMQMQKIPPGTSYTCRVQKIAFVRENATISGLV